MILVPMTPFPPFTILSIFPSFALGKPASSNFYLHALVFYYAIRVTI